MKLYDSITDPIRDWALAQSVFFTASAPLAGQHVNVSPKGLPSTTFTVFGPNQCAYIDATGSGSETISHIYENGRVTVMFCSFDKNPRILRFFCKGRVVEWDQPEFERLLDRMGKRRIEGARAVILLDVWKVQTSCGYGVPMLSTSHGKDEEDNVAVFQDRDTMGHWANHKIEKNELQTYQKDNNYNSMDGLTGLRVARRDQGEILWLTDVQAWSRRMWAQRDAVGLGIALALTTYLISLLIASQFPR